MLETTIYVAIAVIVVAGFDWARTRAARAEAAESSAWAIADHHRDLARQVQEDRDELRNEVKRLTDVIIQFKADGYGALPWAGQQDEHWGAYAIDNETELAEQQRREREAAAEADEDLREQFKDL